MHAEVEKLHMITLMLFLLGVSDHSLLYCPLEVHNRQDINHTKDVLIDQEYLCQR